MGKYMRKARGGGGTVEVMTQGPLGVRTRARAQALQKELMRDTNGTDKISSSTSTQSFAPAQISYLELRSRRLQKVVSCLSNKPPTTRKAASAGECRRLSDLTNSDILADDSSSRLALSVDEPRHTRRKTRRLISDENQEFIYHCHGENEVEGESSLQGFVQRSLQQWTSRGRAPPGVAHSRSNSRSNSVTRELPPPTRELPPRGILTRNQRKLEKRASHTNDCSSKVADMVVVDASSSGKACGLAKKFNVESSYGENPIDDNWSGVQRLTQEGTPSSSNKEGNTWSFAAIAKLSSQLERTAHQAQAPQPTNYCSLDMEIEDFFLQAEQQVHRQFTERYNFDPKHDTPLPGRYDWVKL